MRLSTALPGLLVAGLLPAFLPVAAASAASGGQIDVVVSDVNGTVDPNLGAGLYRDGVRADGTRLAEKVASCAPRPQEGVCTFTDVPAGRYIVESGSWQEAGGVTKTFYKAGTSGTIDGFDATAISIRDESITEIAIQRKKGVTIRGKVTARSGEPNAGALVQVRAVSPLASDEELMKTEFADADGVFSSEGLGGTPHRISVKPAGMGMAMTWYGNAPDRDDAETVRGNSGDVKQADVTLRDQTTLNVPVVSAGPVDVVAYRRMTTDSVTRWDVADKVTKYGPGRSDVKLSFLRGGVYRIKTSSADGQKSVWLNQSSSLATTDDVHVEDQKSSGTDAIDFDAPLLPRAGSVTTLTAPPVAETGRQIELTATLAPGAPPSGMTRVAFYEGDRLLGADHDDTGRNVVKIQSAFQTPGRHTVRAHYQGSRTVRSSYSTPITIEVKAGSTVSAAPAKPLVVGASNAMRVKVGSNGADPSGDVTVSEGATVLGTARLRAGAGGQVDVPLARIAAGTHTLTVAYAGSNDVAASTATVPVSVGKATASVRARAASSFFAGIGGALNVTVSAPGLVPTGKVTIKDGAKVVGSTVLGAAHRGAAKVALRPLAAGTRNLRVEYAGSSDVAARTVTLPVRVVKSAASVQARAAGTLKVRGGAMTVMVRAKSAPTGVVTIKDGARVVGRANLAARARGRLTVKVARLTKGRRTLTVVYSGDSRTAPATAKVLVKVAR